MLIWLVAAGSVLALSSKSLKNVTNQVANKKTMDKAAGVTFQVRF